MKYLVISDTHGKISNAVSLIKKLKPDYCIHLGDVADDCEELENVFPQQKFIFVKGNNDFWQRSSAFPDKRIFELEGKKFFVCHGHKYHVKTDLSLLRAEAKKAGADIVLYGHTHVKHLEKADDMLVINPGASASYCLITIDNGVINAEIEMYER